ncbi:MAG TPA: hypothetical protein VIL49_18625 [Capillimicrobium sp.]|jgi:hypothetical protein
MPQDSRTTSAATALGRAGAAAAAVALLGAGAAAAQQPDPKPDKPKPAPAAPAVTLEARPTTITAGESVRLDGRVANANGRVEVHLERDPAPLGDGFSRQRTVTTNPNGAFSVTLPVVVNSDYRAAAQTTPVATSPNVRVEVRHFVGLRVSTTATVPGQRVGFTGIVKPARAAGKTAVIQRQRPSGTWRTVATTTISAATSSYARYRTRVTIRRGGDYRVKVRGDEANLSGVSAVRTITASAR